MTRSNAAPPLRRLRTGDVVEVRSEAEVLATLERDGTLDRMPFMPEMLASCGSRFTVVSRADTTCFWGGLRKLEDSVHLDGVRCDGSAHGGCQAGCLIFWKEEWLKPVDESSDGAVVQATPPRQRGGASSEDLLRATHAPAAEDGEERWSCQATEVVAATSKVHHWDLRHFAQDVRNGNLGWRTVLRHLLPYLFNTYQGHSRRLPSWLLVHGGAPFPWVHGKLDRTPKVTLDLQPGERVRVRTRKEIRATLDRRGYNRGLSFDPEMLPYCGTSRRVDRRIHKIIDDVTGRMLTMGADCLVLEGAVCRGLYHGLCTRQTETYWREAWLARDGGRVDEAEAHG
ncbi:hypothetical protein [Geodermatophilus sabuli]|uniref:Uncharacterized protein n=1 Tax=Geodermatophilus sabuli TaxID=1564158 RepID=A0A285EKX3_9ACTN|nr:hypothetical protein [Geodermatophilus sabuli]MBB3086911.1 hypothetical protein [Geodermatophilus sabuli]SNX98716.1 hypothetical protein SAMN06893097_11211 [Geodermatophilus sabuli]